MRGFGTLFNVLKEGLFFPLLCLIFQATYAIATPPGNVVWWGANHFTSYMYEDFHSNGVIQCNGENLSNVVHIAADGGLGYAILADGTLRILGRKSLQSKNQPSDLNEIVSVNMAYSAPWAIKKDGTAVAWRFSPITNRLTDVAAVAEIELGILVLKRDSSLAFWSPQHPLDTYRVFTDGAPLSNVTAIANGGLILKKNGNVYSLGHIPNQMINFICPVSLTSVVVNNQPLTNIVAIARSERHFLACKNGTIMMLAKNSVKEQSLRSTLALRRDGTVVAWGNNEFGQSSVPVGLTNVVAIAAGSEASFALLNNGTVTGWGKGSTPPPGLNHVAAIAAGSQFALALVTNGIPEGIFVKPHGKLEEMAMQSDLIFKGKVLSSEITTNASFQLEWDACKTTFELITVFKGKPNKKNISFLHYCNRLHPAFFWSGPSPPPHYEFEKGKCYLVFAANLDRPARYYTPGTNHEANVYREFADIPRFHDDGVIRTADARPLPNVSFKQAHWIELNRLLTNDEASCIYAIDRLFYMSLNNDCDSDQLDWFHSKDFKRSAILKSLLPLTTNANKTISSKALACFRTTPKNLPQIEPFATTLIGIVNNDPDKIRRLNAIGALSGSHFTEVSNSFVQLLTNSNILVRSNAVSLVLNYPGDFAEHVLREAANDSCPGIRAQVAESVGSGQITSLLPVLEKLFIGSAHAPTFSSNEINEGFHHGGGNANDVHASAGYALLEFDLSQSASILQRHLDDPNFHDRFISKLAENDATPWLTNLTEILEARVASVEREAEKNPQERDYIYATRKLFGVYETCWEILLKHLQKMPSSAFSGGKMDRYLDALEKASIRELNIPRDLYRFYKQKGLVERATRYRKEVEAKGRSDMKQVFDQIDAKQ